MKSLFLKDILTHIEGQVVYGASNILVENVVKKPYELRDSTLLFHLNTKENLNLNQFKSYRSCVLVSEKLFDFTTLEQDITVVKVPNVRRAYWSFIHYYRSLFNIPVIGITGTCGKTTTKEMIRHILKERYKVQSTYLSHNILDANLPYLLGIDQDTQAAVFEMGVYGPRDLKISSKYFVPDISVITTIGIDHLNGCKNVETYIKAKTEIIKGMSQTGTLILNADNEHLNKLDLHAFKGNVIYFGFNEKAHFRASNVRYTCNGMEFTLHFDNQMEHLYVPGFGEHNVQNALAAIAAVYTMGFPIKEAGDRLRDFQHVERHLQVYSSIKGCTIIDDTWSSNPTSMEAALNVLKNISNGKKTVAVISRMSLLGKSTRKLHAGIGEKVVEAGIDVLVSIGDEAVEIGRKALNLGMNENKVFFCKDSSELMELLPNIVEEDSIILLKTSGEDAYLRSFFIK
ncbi:UDP-N-acetylmuramoyl-tripeptide--D-alanyl-D-alanine ligase [Bacillus dakarensis]|uniref:UDP-N-acetylmuramoyl-tripeptide--D-alanyl-D- alanine ligase n=1 Tax=Robertmurraya dakarensis TaxID=1926278 RepID=UPI0009816A8F|nr:UDP-N-acetylmuramoyl-tripeptide--D-alanyl-D-alanine ligase [Bacillus dakarensis]